MATEVYRSLMEIVGPKALVSAGSSGAVLRGRLERYYRSSLVMTFGGGTNEIQRDIIGYVGLGLPGSEAISERDRHGLRADPRGDEAAELAASILEKHSTPERLREVEQVRDPLRPPPVAAASPTPG